MGSESTQPHGVAARRAPPEGVTRLPGSTAKADPARRAGHEDTLPGEHRLLEDYDDAEAEFGGGTLPGIGPVPVPARDPAEGPGPTLSPAPKVKDVATSRTEELPVQPPPAGGRKP
jgi:hypothetical protein